MRFRMMQKRGFWFLLVLLFLIIVKLRITNPTTTNEDIENKRSEYFTGSLGTMPPEMEGCPIFQLVVRVVPKKSSDLPETTCHRVPPRKGSCLIADNLFKDKPISNCNHQGNYEFCTIKNDDDGKPEVTCNYDRCRLPIFLGYVHAETGETVWETVFAAAEELSRRIEEFIIPGRRPSNFGFVYIKCFQLDLEANSGIPFDTHTGQYYALQLLVLPPNLFLPPGARTGKSKHTLHPISVNVIFLDSVSRHHFFRSLPKTIKYFSELNKGFETTVLDFQLIQSVKSRTFENLQTLFSGFVNDANKLFDTNDLPPETLQIEDLLGKFRESGYSTLWLEDVCCKSMWGITRDLLVRNKTTPEREIWERLQTALEKAKIDRIDMTLSSCEYMAINDFQNPYYNVESICMNGRHQHEYLLEYLQIYQQYMSKADHPFFSFYECNIAHEDTGRRIQTLDEHLQSYLMFVSQQENVLTIITSDHGNSYGEFLQKSEEGQIELYHPAMFFIIPNAVADQLGKEIMNNLIINQNRLIGMLDLHYTLRSLVTDRKRVADANRRFNVTSDGLFEMISPARTCRNMPMIMPNLCICEDFESSLDNDSSIVIYAYFALGQINNEIQNEHRQVQKNSPSGFGRCKRLELSGFTNVKRTLNSNNEIMLTMNLLVPSGVQFRDGPDVFFVMLDVLDGKITLRDFQRVTSYSRYQPCADDGVRMPFCVCDEISPQFTNQIPLKLSDFKDSLLMKVKIVSTKSTCLYLNKQENDYGFILYAINICRNIIYQVKIQIQAVALDLSTGVPVKTDVYPGEVQFITSGIKSSLSAEWSWTYEIIYSHTTIQ